jgi:hypothetical protein
VPKPPQYPVRSIVLFLSNSPPDRLQTSVKLAHLPACPSIPPASLSAPPIALAAEQLLLTIGRAGVLSCRAIAAAELETLLRLLGPPSERHRSDLKRATDIVLVEDGAVVYWPRTGEQFHIHAAAYAMMRVQATLA